MKLEVTKDSLEVTASSVSWQQNHFDRVGNSAALVNLPKQLKFIQKEMFAKKIIYLFRLRN